jgi:hypothetical protein
VGGFKLFSYSFFSFFFKYNRKQLLTELKAAGHEGYEDKLSIETIRQEYKKLMQ